MSKSVVKIIYKNGDGFAKGKLILDTEVVDKLIILATKIYKLI